ncbi:SNF2 family N-terminal domain-containing protein [Amylocystis lapponica]|nr:SNF2 family N-terminal domain-containing protein [Amylocystis lapponica]
MTIPADPRSLFTPPPPRSTGSLASSSLSTPPSDFESRSPDPPDLPVASSLPPDSPAFYDAPASQPFYINVPALSEKERALYPSIDDLSVEAGEDFDDTELECIVYDITDGNELYYYARFTDGISYKFPAKKFQSKHPRLVADYRRRKAEGVLEEFDPGATYVHPSSRVRLALKIGRRPLPASARRTRESSDDPLALGMNSDYSDATPALTARRSTRAGASGANKKMRELPFSPKKTRVRKHFVVRDSEDDSDVEEVRAPVRRSTRAAKKERDNLDDAAYADDAEDVEAKKKKIVRGKASRAAYGHFRLVADLDYDDRDDEETAALRAHRSVCEKCHKKPTHELLNAPKGRKKGKKSKNADEDDDLEGTVEERLLALGGWVRCLKCPVTAHWGCLASTQRAEILKAALERDRAEWRQAQAEAGEGSANLALEPGKRDGLDVYKTTEFICGSCMKGGFCMTCKEVAVKPDTPAEAASVEKLSGLIQNPSSADVNTTDATAVPAASAPQDKDADEFPEELLFRCFTCKRLAHYSHLPVPQDERAFPDPEDTSPADVAEYYQQTYGWKCADCFSYVYSVEHILAWRPYPENAVDPPRPAGEPANVKSALPREYLIKWADRSYRRTQWVPHMWLLATHPAKLKNFFSTGRKVQLLSEAVSDDKADGGGNSAAAFDIGGDDAEGASVKPEAARASALDAEPDAQRKIPPAWRTVDRVLDVLLWHPDARLGAASKKKGKRAEKGKQKRVKGDEETGDESDGSDAVEARAERDAAFEAGEQLGEDVTETVDQFEERTESTLGESQIGRVVWAFFKWDDLGYDDASWDTPPRKGEPGYAAFETAFKRFIVSRQVTVPLRSQKEVEAFDGRAINGYKKNHWLKENAQPRLGQNTQLNLMPFQVDGVNWLCDNWWNHQNCILADEMGLGKTVQIVTYIGYVMKNWNACPALVVVPNSTISNWVREFERWAPTLRVVPFYGESKAREIIKRYELSHAWKMARTTGAKYHVLVTTYEMITNAKEFTPVFKNTPRWEMLVIDEGQRLKNDESLIFKKLRELHSAHRVIMTGTPLNNNIRELFTLMSFLDPGEWHDLDALAKEHEVLSEESIKQLHARLKPYFLRRIKSEVLQLPPKNEVIVPVSMVRLQKTVYLSIIKHNLDVLRTLSQGSVGTLGAKANAPIGKTNMNNILMQLRKCLQHPYLVSEDIEPKGLSPAESHAKLIDGSGKLVLLKTLLPRLQARGHRVLLFSQFAIALDIVEDFLIGERYKYLRLDGNVKQADRQKGMDEFNKPGSDVFIYLLTTRAGGVGINLWSADTVIIFDPDFNPHQAIARAHRYGQKKTCLVFKLMVQNSAEEKIMQTGKKKMVLDHLIVQKMDDEEGSKDVQSILMHGAESLMKEVEGEQEGPQIHYSEQDMDNLIEKTEKEGDEVEPQEGGGAAFSFAKVWSADKDSLEEMADDANTISQVDSWAQTLERLAAERAKEQAKEVTGRGVRRRAAAVFPKQNLDLDEFAEDSKKKTKGKGKAKSKPTISDESDAYAASPIHSDSEGTGSVKPLDFLEDDILQQPFARAPTPPTRVPVPLPRSSVTRELLTRPLSPQPRVQATSSRPLSPILNRPQPAPGKTAECGLCRGQHGDSPCYMTDDPKNLAEFRYMLIMHAGDEPIEDRRAAIAAIDETLFKQGRLDLIYDQPLTLVETTTTDAPPRKKHKQDQKAVPSQDHASASKAGTSAPIAGQKPRLLGVTATNAAAGPSKRALSPDHDLGAPHKKKVKDNNSSCVVCGRSPHHLVKDCPAVAEGPKRVNAEIERLEGDAAQAPTVSILRHILIKQQRRALANNPT